VLEKFAATQMIDVLVPTTDGRELLLTHYTQLEPELRLLIDKAQARTARPAAAENHGLGGRAEDLSGPLPTNQSLGVLAPLQSAKMD
jgi:hypothetical protein